jgi:hypothetical protein
MLTRAIFIRPDGELIRESVCACANLLNCLLIEEHVLKSNRGSTKTLTDSTRKPTFIKNKPILTACMPLMITNLQTINQRGQTVGMTLMGKF